MFDIVSILARYLFLFYIIYFLLQGLVFIYKERRGAPSKWPSKKQRYTIGLMHIMAFGVIFIKMLDDGDLFLCIEAAIFGVISLAFIIAGFMLTNRVYKNSCPIMFNGIFFLLDISFIMLYRLNPQLAQRQILFSAFGLLAMLLIPVIFKIIPEFEKMKYLYLIIGLGLLIAVYVMGREEYGSKLWLEIQGFSFQPSEFAKLLFVLYFASAFRKKPKLFEALIQCVFAAAFVGISAFQSDFGGAVIFFMTFMIMLYVATGSMALFLLGSGGAVGATTLLFTFIPRLTSHVETRILAWQNPWVNTANAGYQMAQSLFAICTWGLFGSGLFRGLPNNIPVVERDFIFAAICEEFGGVFGLMLIGVYIMVFYRGIHIALRCKKPFHSLVSIGLIALLSFQTFIIIAGVTKLIPMTGVTMPFISYGGSSVFICIVIIGVLQWLYKEIGKEPVYDDYSTEYDKDIEDSVRYEPEFEDEIQTAFDDDGYIDLTGQSDETDEYDM